MWRPPGRHFRSRGVSHRGGHMRTAVILLASLLATALLAAQAPGTFNVVSIKPNKTGAASMSAGNYPGGRWSMVNAPASTLIRSAYPAQLNELVGAPSWVASDRWDVTAVAGAAATREQIQSMMQAMLDRKSDVEGKVEGEKMRRRIDEKSTRNE